MRNRFESGIKRLSGEAGISLIEVLISVSILSLVALYVFQGFFAAGSNIAQVERIDHSKMIAESLSEDIMARPDAFFRHVQWFAAHSNTDSLPEKSEFMFYNKNSELSVNVPEQMDTSTQVMEGIMRVGYTQNGQLCVDRSSKEVKLEAVINFKQLKQKASVKLNAAQMASHTTTVYELSKEDKRYTLVITDDEENKLKASNASGTQPGEFKLYAHLYKNLAFSEISALADSNLSFLNEGVSPWLRLYSWLQLVELTHLNSFMQNVVSIPVGREVSVDAAKDEMAKHKKSFTSIRKHQLDESFGAVPILVEYEQYGDNEPFELEVANLSSYHVDVLLRKKDEKATIHTTVAEGSVNFIDLSEMSYNDYGITLNIVVKEKDTNHILYRLGEHNGRYKIEK